MHLYMYSFTHAYIYILCGNHTPLDQPRPCDCSGVSWCGSGFEPKPPINIDRFGVHGHYLQSRRVLSEWQKTGSSFHVSMYCAILSCFIAYLFSPLRANLRAHTAVRKNLLG